MNDDFKLALSNLDWESIHRLAGDGANTKQVSAEGFNALYLACRDGRIADVNWLLGLGAEIHQVDSNGDTLVSMARINGYEDVAERLLEVRAKVNLRFHGKSSALHLACHEGNVDDVNWLLGLGADIYAVNGDGDTPLALARANNHSEVVECILSAANERKQRAKEVVENGRSQVAGHQEEKLGGSHWSESANALRLACQEGRRIHVRGLLEFGEATIEEEGDTLLSIAASNGDTFLVTDLLGMGAKVNISRKKGSVALFNAITNNHVHVAQLLLAAGADVNRTQEKDVTTLMVASEEGHAKMVECLLDNGANASTSHKTKKTALILARTNGHEAVASIIEAHLQRYYNGIKPTNHVEPQEEYAASSRIVPLLVMQPLETGDPVVEGGFATSGGVALFQESRQRAANESTRPAAAT